VLFASFFIVMDATVCTMPEKEKLLFKWIEKNGGFINPKLEISFGPDPLWNVRGVFAKAHIEHDETLAVIPTHLAICASPEQEDPDCEVALKIIAELAKGADSFYFPYLQILADKPPIMFTRQETSLLEGLPPYDSGKLEVRVKECGLGTTPGGPELLALVWARIMSIDDTPCMIPFWDNFNHHRVAQNLMWGRQPEIFLQAHDNITAGSQVWSEFNQNTPTLFATYGFLEPSPSVWFFDGKDDVRYFFDLSDETVEIHPVEGQLQDLDQMQVQLLEVLLELKEREADFRVAAAAYAGNPDTLTLITSYRAAYERALTSLAAALRQRDV